VSDAPTRVFRASIFNFYPHATLFVFGSSSSLPCVTIGRSRAPLIAPMCGSPVLHTYTRTQRQAQHICKYNFKHIATRITISRDANRRCFFRSAVANVKSATFNQKSKINNIFHFRAPQVNNKYADACKESSILIDCYTTRSKANQFIWTQIADEGDGNGNTLPTVFAFDSDNFLYL